jgi:Na+/melibiose symporter-like transporter
VTEFTQAKHGLRASGFLFSLINFASNLGTAIGQALFMAALSGGGYIAAAESQTDAAVGVVRNSITIWPGIALFVGVFAFLMIKINRGTHEAMLAKLAAEQAQN